jgi:protoporphyrinogen oxidase
MIPRVGVIGAGPAGLSAAYCLARRDVDVAVFEASPHIGGLARSLVLWGHVVDLGPHRFFSADDRINGLWREALGEHYAFVERRTRIHYRGRFFDYPLRIGNVLASLGTLDVLGALASYGWQKAAARGGARDSFEAWVTAQFGRRLYEMFFRTYSEKLWGIPCAELDADFAAQRIRGFSLGAAILAALGIGAGRHKTLADVFAYPLGGSGAAYDRMAEAIMRRGGTITRSCPIGRVLVSGGRVQGIERADGQRVACDHVVSTMPLTLLVRSLDGVPAAVLACVDRLRFRNTILVYLRVGSTSLFPDQWLYIHSGDVAVGRITNFRNWVPGLAGDDHSTVLALEYWADDDDAVWSADDATLIGRATGELARLGLLGAAVVMAGHVVRLPHCYPVYAKGYRATLAPVIDHLRGIANLWPIGRYGAFKYNNQDHSLLMGLLVADNITGGAGHDLWAVNTDYDRYQERAAHAPPSVAAAPVRGVR